MTTQAWPPPADASAAAALGWERVLACTVVPRLAKHSRLAVTASRAEDLTDVNLKCVLNMLPARPGTRAQIRGRTRATSPDLIRRPSRVVRHHAAERRTVTHG